MLFFLDFDFLVFWFILLGLTVFFDGFVLVVGMVWVFGLAGALVCFCVVVLRMCWLVFIVVFFWRCCLICYFVCFFVVFAGFLYNLGLLLFHTYYLNCIILSAYFKLFSMCSRLRRWVFIKLFAVAVVVFWLMFVVACVFVLVLVLYALNVIVR